MFFFFKDQAQICERDNTEPLISNFCSKSRFNLKSTGSFGPNKALGQGVCVFTPSVTFDPDSLKGWKLGGGGGGLITYIMLYKISLFESLVIIKMTP